MINIDKQKTLDVIKIFATFLLFKIYIFIFFYSKGGDLEEELKNVTNNLKSLEAQSDKVSQLTNGP